MAVSASSKTPPGKAPGFVSGGSKNRGAFGARLRARLPIIPARTLIFPARNLTIWARLVTISARGFLSGEELESTWEFASILGASYAI